MKQIEKTLLFEVLASEIDEELENDILEFINSEIAIEVEDLFIYFKSISMEDVFEWLEEFEANWNPASKIHSIVVDEYNYLYFLETSNIKRHGCKKNMADYNISKSNIPLIIKYISESISVKRKYQIEKSYTSVFDFVAILYYFRFVEKMQISEIAHLMGVQVNPLYIHLYNFCWHYSNDFIENNIKYEIEKSMLTDILKQAKLNALEINVGEHPKLIESLSKKYRKCSYSKLEFNTIGEYIKTMYHLIFFDKLTSVQLVILFNIPYSTIQFRLRNLGFNLNREEAMKKKKESRRQDYEKSIRSGKITRLKDRSRHLSDSTINENYARELFDKLVYEYFDSNIYDVLVGVNNVGLLSLKEIDIPIIICNREEGEWYKFVIEYNGEPYHCEEKDMEKDTIASARGWIYLPIYEGHNSGASNNRKIIERWVRNICEKMKRIIIS